MTGHFSLETGLLYSKGLVRLSIIRGGQGEFFYDGDVTMISVPAYVKFTFLKYAFLEEGISLDHQTNYTADGVINDESGVGLEMGIGGKFSIGRISFFLNASLPNMARPVQTTCLRPGRSLALDLIFNPRPI